MKVATEEVECDNDDMAKFGVVGLGGERSAKAVMAAWLNLNMASQVLVIRVRVVREGRLKQLLL